MISFIFNATTMKFVVTCLAVAFVPPEDADVESLKRNVYASVPADEEQNFVRLPPPKPDDWLSSFYEPGQSKWMDKRIEHWKSKSSVNP